MMPSKVVPLKEMSMVELVSKGHNGCPGCGMCISIRQALKGLGKNTVLAIPAGCVPVVAGGPLPLAGLSVPTILCSFEATGAFIAGVEAALDFKGRKKDVNVVGYAGDGGTADIGIQALSGAFERGHDIIYICYDNEAYMNTGIQRSGTTPYGAWTTTTPVGSLRHFKRERKKDMPQIIAAHNLRFVATASIAFPGDFIGKIKRAIELGGPAYIQVHSPCPVGWRFPPDKTIEIARLAVQSGMWRLFEIEDGQYRLTLKVAKRKPIDEYLKPQGRFRHLTPQDIEEIQKEVDKLWEAQPA